MSEGSARSEARDPQQIGGRYTIHDAIGSGGMATVFLARMAEPSGEARTVAVKRLHPLLARDPELVAGLMDEGRVVSRIAHPNVVPLLEVVVDEKDLFLVLEYVHGEPLSALKVAARDRGERIPLAIACAIVCDVLHGLHAAHEATCERGRPLGIVHRDVSPHNVLVGVDGVARVLDFGVAKAAGRLQTTREGRVKGKLSYMAPEQLRGGLVTRRSDIYAASIVLWELLAGRPLHGNAQETFEVLDAMKRPIAPPSTIARDVPPALDAVVMRGLRREPSERYATADEMASDIERAARKAKPSEVAEWLEVVAAASLADRTRKLAAAEGSSLTVPHARRRPRPELRSVAPPPQGAEPRGLARITEASWWVPLIVVTTTVAVAILVFCLLRWHASGHLL